MTIYTADPGAGINQPITDLPSGMGESLSSSFRQGFDEGPVNSILRSGSADALADDPNSAIVPKDKADATLAEYGVKSINVPESGVTQSYLDHVVTARKDALARQQIAASAPSGLVSTPLNFMANLAGSMADPGNIALAFVPFAGEAKAATMLGRAGERFASGARAGVVQSALTTPFTADAAASEGENFTAGNALESVFFNTLAGGLMHAGGGVVSDLVKGRADGAQINEPPIINNEAQPVSLNADNDLPQGIDIPDGGMQSDLATALSREAEGYAYSRAYDDVTHGYMSELDSLQTGFRDNIPDMQAEIADNEHQASLLDATLQDRTSQYQQQRMKYREASQRALNDIQTEKQALQDRNDQLNSLIESHAAAERAKGEQTAIAKGEIPDGLRERVASRASEIRESMSLSPVDRSVNSAVKRVNDAHWSINQQAYRAAVSHMMDGRLPDVEAFYELDNPALRESAIQRIKNPSVYVDRASEPVSRVAEQRYKETLKHDHEITSATEDLEHEFGISEALIKDIESDNPEQAAAMRQTLADIRSEANDNSMLNAFQAFAACMINRGG